MVKVAALVIFICLILGVTWMALNNPTPSSSPTLSQKPDLISKVKKELQAESKKYSGQVKEKDDLSLWWISDDNLNIINDNSPGVELDTYNCMQDQEQRPAFKETAQALGLKVNEIMKQNGFQFNSQNSSKSVDDTEFYDYIQAYTKGNAKCVFVANPDCGAPSGEEKMHYTYSLTCTDKFDQNYQAQAPYLKGLHIKDAIIHVQKSVGDFVRLNVNNRRSGYYIIAKNDSGKWINIAEGQDSPKCNLMQKYSVPKEIYQTCYP